MATKEDLANLRKVNDITRERANLLETFGRQGNTATLEQVARFDELGKQGLTTLGKISPDVVRDSGANRAIFHPASKLFANNNAISYRTDTEQPGRNSTGTGDS